MVLDKNSQLKKEQSVVYFFLGIFALLFFSVFGIVNAENITSENYQIENPLLNISGGLSSSPNFKYISSIGELTIGESSGTSLAVQFGWLYFPTIVLPPPDTGGGGNGGGGSGSNGGLEVDYPPVVPPTYPSDGKCKIADFNCDNYVNIADLSILLFYTDQNGQAIRPYDLSDDGVIDIRDISILFYYWDF